MLRLLACCCALPLVLAACSPGKPAADAPTPAPEMSAHTTPAAPATTPAAKAATAPAAQPQSHGRYTIGDATLTLHHALVLRSDNKEIAVLLTPTALTNKERAAILENPMFPGMALFRKSAPAYPGRYPYVVVEVRLSGPASADNVKSYYIKAYGVRKVNHTDNINGMPDTNSRFKVIEVQGEHMRMQFSGQTKILGKLRSWTFDIEL